MKYYLLILCWLVVTPLAAQDSFSIHGKVTSLKNNEPLPGVNVVIKGTTSGTTTDADGIYFLQVHPKEVVVFSFIGYAKTEVVIDNQSELNIQLDEDISTLGEVVIVSTGYQQLSRERTNGSFVKLDQDLIDRRVSTGILSRLEDVTSGVIFNRNVNGRINDISIRGLSTINSQSQPLIVIDNFPYDGDINTINPNDVESITVLKDAASAAIWGARAGNGVIVITTKKGKANQPLRASFNSNFTFAGRPDLFYTSRMSSSDFIGVERMLFNQGFYEESEYSYYNAPITPAVELMIANRDGLLSDSQLESQLTALGGEDIRTDYSKYLYRQSVNRQYALNVNGGSDTHRYYLSAGWDKNTETLVGNSYDRVTLNMNNTWSALEDRLTFSAGIYYSENTTKSNGEDPNNIFFDSGYPMYPYARFRDDNGNNIPITKDYRLSFIKAAEDNGLLNWDYNPLDEIAQRNNKSVLRDYRINGTLNYRILDGLHAEVLYQYWRGLTERRDLRKEASYFTRNLINLYSIVDGTGVVTNNIPQGAIYDLYNGSQESQSIRGQLNYVKAWEDHSVAALAGYEVREQNIDGSYNRYYGYNDELASTKSVDYVTAFEQYNFPGYFTQIPYLDQETSLTDRFISYYANAAYTYKGRYSVSGSVRRDQSNLFGVRGNQRSVPLWSAGLGWTLSNESFYKSSLVPYLKLRATYGYNGNVNKNISAYTTAINVGNDFTTGLPYSIITNPPNPDLRWERVSILNIGVDFELKNKRISGSIEYYSKIGKDLIGTSPYAPSTGIVRFTANNASTQGRGVDLALNSLNIDRSLKWNTTFLFSSIHEKVLDYETIATGPYLINYGNGYSGIIAPQEGKPLYAIYSYSWAGLDPETGNPQSYVNGSPSSDYSAIKSSATPETIVYHGSARPTVFGSVRNTFTWKQLSLSFNVSYRLGYYFRKTSVRYAELLSGHVEHGDFSKRWTTPGDELVTNVPSLPAEIDYNRDDVYAGSAALVAKGDNIRLQDINLSYTIGKDLLPKMPLSRLQVYAYLNNVGILWKSAEGNIDPDFPNMRPVRTFSIGVRADF